MHGYIQEFNRLKPHSSHDLVFKIWRNNKTEATLRVFVSDCELLVTKGAYHLTEKSGWGSKSIMVSNLPVYRRNATSVTV